MKNSMLFAASALLLLSCSKTNSLDGVKRDGEKTIFNATVEGIPSSGTKIYSDRDLKVCVPNTPRSFIKLK